MARAALLALTVAGVRAHPMHTTVAEVVQLDARGTTSVRIRVFADDWRAAVPRFSDPSAADSAAARYIRGTFALADRMGRPVPTIWESAVPSGDVILLRLRAAVPGGLAGARVTSLMLCDRFEDQVNIVRATYGGRSTTLLFTRGEGSQTMP